ncbi:MAG TPA: flagellar motor protein MotB [Bdellovibrionota bacterium]|jgi:chemotaxis protein MotB|nr:flagellar motor protein MotB [Bdellovibrionota bacterium]
MKKKHPEHANHERWLVSYADFITLLFAFFVVMYAISIQDMAKLKSAAQSIRDAFGNGGDVGVVGLEGQGGGDTVNPFEVHNPPQGRVLDLPAGKVNVSADPDPELKDIKEKLEESVSLELGVTSLSDKVQMVFDSRGLVVRLAVADFFDEGRVDVVPDLRPLLDRVGRVLATTTRLIRVEGHTELGEEKWLEAQKKAGHPSPYATGWELSAARGAWVARYWISRFGFDPSHVGVAGYSHFRPIHEGGGDWAKGTNRRIEIIVLNNNYRK